MNVFKLMLKVLCGLMIVGVHALSARGADKKMGDLHTKIRKDLVAVIKNNPHTQKSVSPIIDSVDKLHKQAKDVHQKRVAYKGKSKVAATESGDLRKKNEELKKRLLQAKDHIDGLSKQLTVKNQQVASLSKQKEQLIERAIQLEAHMQHLPQEALVQVPELSKPEMRG